MAKQVSGVFESLIDAITNSAHLIFVWCLDRLSRLPKTWRKVLTPKKDPRFGTKLHSVVQRLLLSLANPLPLSIVWRRKSPGTSTPWSSTPWALRAQSRLLKTTTLWCSLLISELRSQPSRRLARTCTRSRLSASTLSSHQRDWRRLMLFFRSHTMLLRLLTRSESCERRKALWMLFWGATCRRWQDSPIAVRTATHANLTCYFNSFPLFILFIQLSIKITQLFLKPPTIFFLISQHWEQSLSIMNYSYQILNLDRLGLF